MVSLNAAATGAGILAFVVYFLGALGFCVVFCALYTRITPHREFDLIVRDGNGAAAIAFGGSLLGFAIALAGAIHVAGSVLEFVIWGAIAFVTQLIAYAMASFVHPGLAGAIERNGLAAAVWVAAASIAAGLLSAACMSP